jgi:hypothetical protein
MQLETVAIKNPKGEGSVNINKSDFIDGVHELYKDPGAVRVDEKPVEEGEAVKSAPASRNKRK